MSCDSSCGCFVARAVVTSEMMNKPLAQVRAMSMAKAFVARRNLENEFPELSKRGSELLNANASLVANLGRVLLWVEAWRKKVHFDRPRSFIPTATNFRRFHSRAG